MVNSNKFDFTDEHRKYFNKSVLCWLATVNKNNEPSVSPKEMFMPFETDKILIANIASPNSVSNIITNNSVCVSILDIYVQKGFKMKGRARIITLDDKDFEVKSILLKSNFTDKFSFKSIIEVTIDRIERIMAPSYHLFPDETTEESQVTSALETYEKALLKSI